MTSTTSVGVRDGMLRLGDHLTLSFQRTLRIPDDGSTYPLPPGLGAFPIYHVDDYADRVPAEWRGTGGSSSPCTSARRCGCRSSTRGLPSH